MSQITRFSFTLKQYSNFNLSSNILFRRNLQLNSLDFIDILNIKKVHLHTNSRKEFRDILNNSGSGSDKKGKSEPSVDFNGKTGVRLVKFPFAVKEFHTSLSNNTRGNLHRLKYRNIAHENDMDHVAGAKSDEPNRRSQKEEKKSENDKESDFQSLEINEKLKKALVTDLGFTKMSLVQKSILKTNHDGETTIYKDDLLVRAKTGTGKTIAFLLYAIEYCLSLNRFESVFSTPTRELANQIASEADKLVKYLRLRVKVSVGGTSRSFNLREILQSCDILVATPGRLNDFLLNEPLFKDQLKSLKTLVFDEADLLLEMGFKSQIESILRNIPEERTTLMFSATLSNQVKEIARVTLRKDYKHVDCVPKSDVDTHLKVKQSFTIVPTKEQLYLIQDIISHHKNENPAGKIMIFFPSTNQVIYFTELMNNLRIPGVQCMMIHAKLTQVQRSRISDQFRRSRSGILVTTDVSARGVDYPNVSLVVQVGMPSNREQYVHRIGRTGRANNEGEAILVLSPFEKRYLGHLSMVPIHQELRFNPSVSSQNKERVEHLTRAIQKIDEGTRKNTALSFMVFHLAHMNSSGMRKDTIVKAAQDFSKGFMGLERLPTVSESYAQKMGLLGVPGLETRRHDNLLPFMSHGQRNNRGSYEKEKPYEPSKSELLKRIRELDPAFQY